MIRRLFLCLLALVLCVPGAQAVELPPLVRLQVVAESDAPAAQRLKLELRDVCLACARICLADAPDADAAYMRLVEHTGDFEAALTARAAELGYDGAIRVETGVLEFPDRIYGDLFVPAGEYRALRVTIGEGAGHNWWCVLYPSLCILDEGDFAGGMYYSRIWNWIRRRIGGLL